MAVIDTIEEFKQCVGFSSINLDLCTVEPFLNKTLPGLLRKVIGNAYYKDLLAKYEADTLTTAEAEIWAKVQCAAAHYAVYLMVDSSIVQLDDSGIYRRDAEENKSAYQWQTRQYKQTHLNCAHDALHEVALCLCENKPILWQADTSRMPWEKSVVWRMDDFKTIRSLGNWCAYWTLCTYFDYVLECLVIPCIGQDAYDSLIVELQASCGATATDTKLLRAIRTIAVYGAIGEALGEVSFAVTADGLVVNEINNQHQNDASSRAFSAAEVARLSATVSKRLANAKTTLLDYCVADDTTTTDPTDDKEGCGCGSAKRSGACGCKHKDGKVAYIG